MSPTEEEIQTRRLRLQDELRQRIARLLADPFVRRTLGTGPSGVIRPLRSPRRRGRLKPIITFPRGYADSTEEDGAS